MHQEDVVRWLTDRALRRQHEAQLARAAGDRNNETLLQHEVAALMSAAVDLRQVAADGGPEQMKIEVGDAGDYVERLQERMQKARITAADLARKSGINESQFSRWFNTGRQPTLKNIAKIEKAMEALAPKKRAH